MSGRLLWAIRLLTLGLIVLHLAAPLFAEATAWGLWPATYLLTGWRWGLALMMAALALFGDRLTVVYNPTFRTAWPWLRLVLALLTAIPFYLFRIQHLRWGDAYILVNAIPHPEVRLTYVWQAPLDVFIHAKAWALGNRLFGWPDPVPVYTILSTAAGVTFVWVLLGLAAEIGRDTTERALLAGPVLTLGTMQLFFGYIENYTFMTLGVLIYCWLALRTLRGESALIWPATALALTHAFHPATIVLAPSLVYLALRLDTPGSACDKPPVPSPSSRPSARAPRPGGLVGARGGIGGRVISIAVPYLLVLVGILALMTAGGHGIDALLGVDFPGGGDRRWFVPLFHTATRWEHYTLFSPGHLVDIVNEQLLVAPAIWPALILVAVLAWRRLPWHDPVYRFLALCAGLYLLLTLVWNPDYGGQRDWDLFAPAAVPAALWLGYVLPRGLPERGALKAAAWALIASQAYHLIAWVYQNTLPWSWS
jgi:hypothetical protein